MKVINDVAEDEAGDGGEVWRTLSVLAGRPGAEEIETT